MDPDIRRRVAQPASPPLLLPPTTIFPTNSSFSFISTTSSNVPRQRELTGITKEETNTQTKKLIL